MPSCQIRVGDIFDSECDVLIVPCSTAGTITHGIDKGLFALGLPRPEGRMDPGSVHYSSVSPGLPWRAVGFAASVTSNGSSPGIIESIGTSIGAYVTRENMRSVAIPLLGAGAGGVSPRVAAQALFSGFRANAPRNSVLFLYLLNADLYETVNEAIETLSEMSASISERAPAIEPAREDPARSRNAVFISYSHEDREWLERLQVHLRPLERDEAVAVWDDTRIRPGTDWRGEIKKAIGSAKVAILLVSADFLASDFIAKNELPPLLQAAKEEGAVILPVVVRPCRFTRTKSLSGFQAVNDPDKSIGSPRSITAERILTKVVDEVERALTQA